METCSTCQAWVHHPWDKFSKGLEILHNLWYSQRCFPRFDIEGVGITLQLRASIWPCLARSYLWAFFPAHFQLPHVWFQFNLSLTLHITGVPSTAASMIEAKYNPLLNDCTGVSSLNNLYKKNLPFLKKKKKRKFLLRILRDPMTPRLMIFSIDLAWKTPKPECFLLCFYLY